MRAILVGEAPVAATVGCEALGPEGASGRRLARILGVERVSEVAATVNLFDQPTTVWVFEEAEARARSLLDARREARWILCGRRVARAFGLAADAPWMDWSPLDYGRLAAVLPHPSGLSRWWNESANVEGARAWLETAVRDEAWA